RGDAGYQTYQSPRNQKNNYDLGDVYNQQAKVDAEAAFAKDPHYESVCSVNSGELHVISQSVRRDSLQHKLPRIGVFALITFKRNCKEMDSDEYDHGNDNCQKHPPAQLNALFKISNTGCHRSTIVDQLFVPIECQYAIENNHGSNECHGYSLVSRHF